MRVSGALDRRARRVPYPGSRLSGTIDTVRHYRFVCPNQTTSCEAMRNLLIVSVLFSVNVFADEKAVQRVEGYLSNVQSLEGEFQETIVDDASNLVDEARGKLYLQRPGQFRWDYSEPYLQSVVSNGKKVWVYDSELEQVTVKTLDSSLDDTPAMLLSSTQPVEDTFLVGDLVEKGGIEWVELKPKTAEAVFASVRLGFAGDELDVMELVDNFGQTTRLQFSAVVKNPTLDGALFEFTPPPGVDVIGE